MKYILPNKDLLETRSEELGSNKKYYNLSKIFYKKDIQDKLRIPIGIDDDNQKYYLDLEDKSAILISGETGSGKSIFIHSMIISLLLKNTPDDASFIFVDPRNIEFNEYKKIPHNINIDSNKYSNTNCLNYIIDLIEERKTINYEKLPHIFIFIDEASELLNIKNVNELLSTILKEGKKYNIHLIMSTSSYFKENIDKEILKLFSLILTFDLASKEQADYIKIDGSNLLTIYGEAYVKAKSNIYNIQTPYVSEKDINNVVNFIINQ